MSYAEDSPIRHRGPSNAGGNFVVNKTQEYLSSKGFGWLMEVDESSQKKQSASTTAEPQQSILEELDIDLVDIFWRVKRVLLVFGKEQTSQDDLNKLRQADFWGPFFIIVLYSMLIVWGQLQVITWVFLIWIIGSGLIWLLANLLSDQSALPVVDQGSDEQDEAVQGTSFGQVVSFTGYSLLPQVAVVVLLLFLTPIVVAALGPQFDSTLNFLLRTISTVWSAWACARMMATESSLTNKRNLLFIPLILLFGFFATMQSGV
ncbi:hypothetical protein AKO1_011012 [Acrasis kona]|uniref:Protein YIPF n=1 Tax=Acrasis kona TaxID=1008807 RepID=A0AAW2YU62_9EUKA